MSGNEFRFFLSCDINLPVTFRIERLEGNLPPISNTPNSGIFFYYFNFFLKKFSEEDEVWVNELSSAFEVSLSPILLLLFFMQKLIQQQRIEEQSYMWSAHYTLMVLLLVSPQEQGFTHLLILLHMLYTSSKTKITVKMISLLALISWKSFE